MFKAVTKEQRLAKDIYTIREFIVAALGNIECPEDKQVISFKSWFGHPNSEVYQRIIGEFDSLFGGEVLAGGSGNGLRAEFLGCMVKAYGLGRADSGVPEAQTSLKVKRAIEKIEEDKEKLATPILAKFFEKNQEVYDFLNTHLPLLAEAANAFTQFNQHKLTEYSQSGSGDTQPLDGEEGAAASAEISSTPDVGMFAAGKRKREPTPPLDEIGADALPANPEEAREAKRQRL